MNYIINPMYIYLIHLFDVIAIFLRIVSLVIFALGFFKYVVYTMNKDSSYSCISIEQLNKEEKEIKYLLVFGFVLLFISMCIPSKDVLIEMQIAKYATYENAETVVEAVKDSVDYVVHALKEI